MTKGEHQIRRSILLGAIVNDVEKANGVPSLDDFIFMDYAHEPARIRLCGNAPWLCYWHPDKFWVTKERISREAAQAIWESCRTLSSSEVEHFKLWGGVAFLRPAPSRISTKTEPTNRTYGTKPGEDQSNHQS